MNKKSYKTDIRVAIRNHRNSLGPELQFIAAQRLLIQLQSVAAFMTATKIAMYLVNDGEIDPVEVMKWCWINNKQTYVPIISQGGDKCLLFAEVNQHTEYVENQFGIREPIVDHNQTISAQKLDLVLTPLVAFDQKGNRIGMGGGFYDTTFAFLKNHAEAQDNGTDSPAGESIEKPELIGIAHEIQRVEDISAEQWDIPLTTVVTDKKVYKLSPGINF